MNPIRSEVDRVLGQLQQLVHLGQACLAGFAGLQSCPYALDRIGCREIVHQALGHLL
ncbi:hypothetical protein RB201_36520 [Streptomyces sp. S1A(2023)]